MKEKIALIEFYRRKSLNKNRVCFEQGCNKNAIDSHILQKNGIISNISERGHVVECVIDPFQNDNQLRFKPSGINEVFTFKGFCQDHDNMLFKEIEKYEFDLTNYKHQLLFAYRTSVNETRKKETMLDFYNSLKTDPRISLPRQLIEQSIIGYELGISDGDHTRQMLYNNIHYQSSHDFLFYTIQLPLYEVCICGVYTFETTLEIKAMELFQSQKYKAPLTDVFVTFIPTEKESILSIGFMSGYNKSCDEFYKTLFENNDRKAILHHVSDIMLLQIENWIVSKTFYTEKIKNRESQIKSIINWAQDNWDERRSLDLNLLE
jgi:hypothetical protein